MVRVSRFAALMVVGVALSASWSCKKAELGDPTPTGITAQVDSSSITADDGSVVVRAQVFEDGVALLDEPVRFSIDGALSQPEVIVPTDPLTGIAEYTFTNLRTVGSGNVIASAGAVTTAVTASAPLTVTPGIPATVSVDAGGSVVADQGSAVLTVAATDAFANAIPAAAVNLSTNAPGAIIVGNTLQNLHVAGSWSLVGSVAGSPAVTGTDGYVVTAGAAAQAKTSLGQSVVGSLQSLDIYCDELDAYGNSRNVGGTWVLGEVSTSPSSTIVAGTSPGRFIASAFTATGPATATCDNGPQADVKTFQVVAQTAANTVVANLDRSVVEAGMSATLTCAQLNPFGNDTGATFVVADVSTTAGATVASLGANRFTLSNLLTKGTFTATCTKTVTGSDDFAVVDTTAPLITAFAITLAGSPHNGPLDGRHAPNEEITITMTATDAVGLARQEIGVVSGGSFVTTTNPVLLPASTTTSTRTFKVQLDTAAATFSTIVIRGQAADTTGNTSTFAGDITVTVDPGAGFAVTEPAIAIRTHWEDASRSLIPIAVVSSGSNFYVKNVNIGTPASDEILRVTNGGTTTTLIAADFIAGQNDNSGFGFVQVPGSFGGRNLFHSLVGGTSGQIAAFTGSTPGVFTLDPIAPRDMSFGTVGTDTGLFHYDNGGTFGTIFRVDSTGASFPFFIDSSGSLANATGVVVVGGAVAVSAGGTFWRVAGSPATAVPFNMGNATDLCLGTGSNLLAPNITELRRLSTIGAPAFTSLSSGFVTALGCAVDAAGTAFILDRGVSATIPARLYKVTGY